jgi:hypothetical protein
MATETDEMLQQALGETDIWVVFPF